MKDITVMNSPPMSVTAHSCMLSKNPHSSTLVINSDGYNVCCGVAKPAEPIIALDDIKQGKHKLHSSAAPDAHDGAALLPPYPG